MKKWLSYSLRYHSHFIAPLRYTVFHRTESISLLGQKIWDLVPDNLKSLNNAEAFKLNIRKLKLDNNPCRLCKVYVNNIGFL